MIRAVAQVRKALIIFFFISLPVTSFPYFPPSFGGNTAVVRPLLVYPLLGLVLILTIPRLFTQKLPQPMLLVLIFFLWALISSLLPVFRNIQSPWAEVKVVSREIRTLITLGLAVSVYLTTALIAQTREGLRFSLRWIYAGLAMALIWGSLQAIYILDLIPGWFEIMNSLQSYVSIHRLNPTRISGMTYEPSWFADQIVILWLPLILGSSLTDYTVFHWRWKWVTVEKILLVWTLGILAFTLSRTGLILGVGLIPVGIVLKFLYSTLIKREEKRLSSQPQASDDEDVMDPKRKWLLLLLLGALLFLALFAFLSAKSEYISRIWSYWLGVEEKNLSQYFTFIGFGSRIAYWQTAYNIFIEYPIFGVGLGNFTVYFPELLPFQHLAKTPELLRHLVPQQGRSRVVTAKHFIFRILAETGLIGIGILFTFLTLIVAGGIYLWLSRREDEHFWGTLTLLGVVAFLGDAFSFDSFAIPNPWVLFGLLTSAINILSPDRIQEEKKT